jgi:hypothetical protein
MMTRVWIALLLAVLLVFEASACTAIDGECWSRSENGTGSGAGGGPIVPNQGGYGDVAPEPQGAGDSPSPPDCASVGMFSPSLFNFVTIVADNGAGLAGGWQEASGTFSFVDDQDPPRAYSCSVKVGMPLRSEVQGKISHAAAADMSATVLSYAGHTVIRQKGSWVTAQFCEALRTEMTRLFDEAWPKLGERVTQ